VHEVPRPRRQDLKGILEPAGHREDRHPDQSLADIEGKDPDQREQAVVLQDGRQGRSFDQVARPLVGPVEHRLAVVPCPAVANHRLRCHEDANAGQPGSPAEVHVVLGRRQAFVGWTDLRQGLLRDEHGARGDVENLPDPVVLALVDLAVLER
jgi:hypothetical protein